MTKSFLNLNSQKFLTTHFHITNELDRFLSDATMPQNSSHQFIIITTPLMYGIIAMNDNLLKFTLNEPLINFLREVTKYFAEIIKELDNIYAECNEKSENFNVFKKESEKIYKKTVADLRNSPATNQIEKLHLKHISILMNAIKKITLLKMQINDCSQLTPIICDLDLTIKDFLKKTDKFLRF